MYRLTRTGFHSNIVNNTFIALNLVPKSSLTLFPVKNMSSTSNNNETPVCNDEGCEIPSKSKATTNNQQTTVPSTDNPKVLNIDIVSDNICPW
jgi:hypothetical protein